MIKAVLAGRPKIVDFKSDVKLGSSNAQTVPYETQNGRTVDANFHFVFCGEPEGTCYAQAKSADLQDSHRSDAQGSAIHECRVLNAKSALSSPIRF
jgi:hypothetical protein